MTTPAPPLTVEVQELPAVVGRSLGPSDWRALDGAEQYTRVTGAGPEFLVLCAVVPLIGTVLRVRGTALGVNYGLDALRFGPSAAHADAASRVRLRGTVADARPVAGGWQLALDVDLDLDLDLEAVDDAGDITGWDGDTGEPAAHGTLLLRYSPPRS